MVRALNKMTKAGTPESGVLSDNSNKRSECLPDADDATDKSRWFRPHPVPDRSGVGDRGRPSGGDGDRGGEPPGVCGRHGGVFWSS